MPEETITLREAAQRLARIRRPRGRGIESSRLFSLLRSGEFRAGFYILGGTTWIEIPLTYWHGIDSRKFRRIARTDDPKSGTYTIRANEFPDQVASIICGEIGSNERTSGQHQIELGIERVTDVIKATASPYEVTIKTKDFSDYLQRHGLEESKTTTNVGRKRKEGWRELCSYMAAYFAAHYRDRGDEPVKIDRAKADIIKIAKDDGVPDLPDETTIKEQISKSIGFLNRPEFKLRKPTAADRK
jgi:hypothetical protein